MDKRRIWLKTQTDTEEQNVMADEGVLADTEQNTCDFASPSHCRFSSEWVTTNEHRILH